MSLDVAKQPASVFIYIIQIAAVEAVYNNIEKMKPSVNHLCIFDCRSLVILLCCECLLLLISDVTATPVVIC